MASTCIQYAQRRMGGKVYVNWRMHAAPMRVTSEVMLGIALPRIQATAQ
jgi:hypothetical protein